MGRQEALITKPNQTALTFRRIRVSTALAVYLLLYLCIAETWTGPNLGPGCVITDQEELCFIVRSSGLSSGLLLALQPRRGIPLEASDLLG